MARSELPKDKPAYGGLPVEKQTLRQLLFGAFVGFSFSVLSFVMIISLWLTGKGKWVDTLILSCVGVGAAWVGFVPAREVVKRFRSKNWNPPGCGIPIVEQFLSLLFLKSLLLLVMCVVMFHNIIYWWLAGEGNWFGTLYASCLGLVFGWFGFVNAREAVKRILGKTGKPP